MASKGFLESLVKSTSLEEAAAALDTLLKITQNVLDNPTDERFRQIKIANKSFSKKVWRFEQAREFLLSRGWTLVDDVIVLVSDIQMDQVMIELTQVRSSLDPEDVGAVTTGETVLCEEADVSVSANEKERIERMKKLKEMQRKREKEKKRVLKQVQEDRREMDQRAAKPSHGRRLEFGANLNRFEDIGVDLNAGGG